MSKNIYLLFLHSKVRNIKAIMHLKAAARADTDTAMLPDPRLGSAVAVEPDAKDLDIAMFRLGWANVTINRGTGVMTYFADPGPGKQLLFSVEPQEDGTKVAVVAVQDVQSGQLSCLQMMQDEEKLRLYKVATPPQNDSRLPEHLQGLIMFDTENNVTCWRREQQQAKIARGMMHVPSRHPMFEDAPDFYAKVWVYMLERAEHAHVMFELSFLQFHLLGDLQRRWVKDSVEQWKYLIKFWHRSPTHLQRSAQGELKYATKWTPDNLPTDDEMTEFVRESCASAYGSLVAILHFAKPVRVPKKSQLEDNVAGARGRLVLLTCIV